MLFHGLHSLHPLIFHDADAVPYVHQPGHRKIDLGNKRGCQSLTDQTKTRHKHEIHQMLRNLMTSYNVNIKAIWLQQFIIQIMSIDIVGMTFILNYERMAYDI